MSMSSTVKRSMRIIALPLTTATRTPDGGYSHLTYYHFVVPPQNNANKSSWTHWVTKKASDIWAGFGKAPEGTWKRKTFLYGERMIDRIDFEELALKSIDTSLAPRIFSPSEAASTKERMTPTIPLIYPGRVCNSPVTHFRDLLEKRIPRHRKGCIVWMLIAPFTAPFMLIPVIPNLPFFFCVWRSWSHWRAYKASTYLEEFVKREAIIPQDNRDLTNIYVKFSPPVTLTQNQNQNQPNSGEKETLFSDTDSDASSTPTTPTTPPVSESENCDTDSEKAAEAPPRLLLTKEAVPELVKAFQLDSTFQADLYRALEQARLRTQKARSGLS